MSFSSRFIIKFIGVELIIIKAALFNLVEVNYLLRWIIKFHWRDYYSK